MSKRLMEHLPENYEGSRETVAYQEAWQPERDALWAARDDLLAQLDPSTATWGLVYWERAQGLTADAARTLAQRRAQVIAKLRGRPPVTLELVKSVCQKIISGDVDVIERIPNYWLDIDLVGVRGLPANADDLARELDELLPAHLGWGFLIHYRTHEELRPYTHGQLRAYTHQTIRGGELTNGAH